MAKENTAKENTAKENTTTTNTKRESPQALLLLSHPQPPAVVLSTMVKTWIRWLPPLVLVPSIVY